MQILKKNFREMDYISKLPQEMLELILCRLPIQEAARTSVLSKDWRYIWTTIPNLVFDENTLHVSNDEDELYFSEDDHESQRKRIYSCKLLYAVLQVLFTHNGKIHEFTLSMREFERYIGIDVILHHLSREKTLKKLTLKCSPGYNLPSSFFSLNQLTDLYLSGCGIDIMPTFSGFGRLTTLFLEKFKTTDENHINLLSMSPLLKTVTMNIDLGDIDYNSVASTVTKLFRCFPLIENLSLWYDVLQCYSEDKLPQKLETALVHLKYFCVEHMCFAEDSGIHILVPAITSFPNLEKLKVEIDQRWAYGRSEWFTLEDYSNIRFEHLSELDIINVSNRKNAELEFVKLILAKSPVLKKARIFVHNEVQIREISEILLGFPRASSLIELTVVFLRRRELFEFNLLNFL